MPTLRQALTARLRRWLLGPELEAEIHAAVMRLAAVGAGNEATPAASPAAAGWHALPGNRLELADTGFQIELRLQGSAFAFVLITPEGGEFAAYSDLEPLKHLAVRMADQRSQFIAAPAQPYQHGQPRH